MYRPWSTRSSPVLTTATISKGSTTPSSPRNIRAAPTPPARATNMACTLLTAGPGPVARPPAYARSSVLTVAVDATPLLGQRTGIGAATGGMLRALAARPDLALVGYGLSWSGRRELPAALPRGVRPVRAPM